MRDVLKPSKEGVLLGRDGRLKGLLAARSGGRLGEGWESSSWSSSGHMEALRDDRASLEDLRLGVCSILGQTLKGLSDVSEASREADTEGLIEELGMRRPLDGGMNSGS